MNDGRANINLPRTPLVQTGLKNMYFYPWARERAVLQRSAAFNGL